MTPELAWFDLCLRIAHIRAAPSLAQSICLLRAFIQPYLPCTISSTPPVYVVLCGTAVCPNVIQRPIVYMLGQLYHTVSASVLTLVQVHHAAEATAQQHGSPTTSMTKQTEICRAWYSMVVSKGG